MMPGMVMMWPWAIADIPSGWHLCDGTVGTPDLRDKFIICAREDVSGVPKTYVRGYWEQLATSLIHTHEFTGDGHAHDLGAGSEVEDVTPLGDHVHETTISSAHGDTEFAYTLPPFYAMSFIMKL